MFQSYLQPFLLCLPLFISPSSFSFPPSLSLLPLCPTLSSLPSPISFLPSFLLSIPPACHPYLTLGSCLSLPPPVLALSLIIDTIIKTKGQHLGSDLGTLGRKRRPPCALVHPRPAITVCSSPWLLSELPQLRDRHSCSLQQKERRRRLQC